MQVTGSCDGRPELDDVFIPQDRTADGRWYYKGQNAGAYLYYDPDCTGGAGFGMPGWTLDSYAPSTTRTAGLDGDQTCFNTLGVFQGTATEPPFGAYTWILACSDDDGLAQDWIELTLTELAPTPSPTITAVPTTAAPTPSPTTPVPAPIAISG